MCVLQARVSLTQKVLVEWDLPEIGGRPALLQHKVGQLHADLTLTCGPSSRQMMPSVARCAPCPAAPSCCIWPTAWYRHVRSPNMHSRACE
jgi:hypothetical protein